MKQKKNSFDADFVSVNAIEVLVTKKIEKNFSQTKWSHFMYFNELQYGKDYRNVARSFVDALAKNYPDLYFMEKPVVVVKCR